MIFLLLVKIVIQSLPGLLLCLVYVLAFAVWRSLCWLRESHELSKVTLWLSIVLEMLHKFHHGRPWQRDPPAKGRPLKCPIGSSFWLALWLSLGMGRLIINISCAINSGWAGPQVALPTVLPHSLTVDLLGVFFAKSMALCDWMWGYKATGLITCLYYEWDSLHLAWGVIWIIQPDFTRPHAIILLLASLPLSPW